MSLTTREKSSGSASAVTPDFQFSVQVTGFRPVTNIAATKGIGSMQSLHWQVKRYMQQAFFTTSLYMSFFFL
jgi:hypothetical protein